jgi:uncharacterized membrane-anchored protein
MSEVLHYQAIEVLLGLAVVFLLVVVWTMLRRIR